MHQRKTYIGRFTNDLKNKTKQFFTSLSTDYKDPHSEKVFSICGIISVLRKKKKTPRVNPNVNCGLWAVTTCQCRFSNCNKCATTLVRDVDKAESYACVGSGGMLKISVPSIQLCCELKTSLLKSLFKKKTKMLN